MRVYRSNRMEALSSALADVLKTPCRGATPLQTMTQREVVVVHSQGMAHRSRGAELFYILGVTPPVFCIFGSCLVPSLSPLMISIPSFSCVSVIGAQLFRSRDLKPEKYLLSTEETVEQTHLKLIDFGMSRRFTKGTPMTTRVVTPYLPCFSQSCKHPEIPHELPKTLGAENTLKYTTNYLKHP